MNNFFVICLVKDLKELLTAIQIGQADKMANVAKAIKLYNLTKEWMMEGDSRGRTPLHIASSYGYQNAVKIIVKENIDSIATWTGGRKNQMRQSI